MRPRLTAVSAVSDSEKKAETIKSSKMAPSAGRSMGLGPETLRPQWQLSAAQNIFHGIQGHVTGDKGAPQSTNQDESELAVLHFLVMAHGRQKRIGGGSGRGDVADEGGQARFLQMARQPVRIVLRTKTQAHRQLKRQRHADRHAFAVNQAR